MSAQAEQDDLLFVIITHYDAAVFCRLVSEYLKQGWQLHGEMKLQTVADVSSMTFARLTYVQAIIKGEEKVSG